MLRIRELFRFPDTAPSHFRGSSRILLTLPTCLESPCVEGLHRKPHRMGASGTNPSAGVPGRGVCPTHCSERPRGRGPVAKRCLLAWGAQGLCLACALPLKLGIFRGATEAVELIAPGAERESERP